MNNLRLMAAIVIGIGAALVAGSFTTANAADPGRLRIQNKSQYFMYYTIPADNWMNCNDKPFRGQMILVAPRATSDYFEFLRTDGHGCNGEQGQFALVPSIPIYSALPQQFSYDSHGGMGLVGPNPNYASQLIDEQNHNYMWIVTPTP